MEAKTTRRPGQSGKKKLVQRFGDRLIFVRYRYDLQRRRRYTTVELIVDEQPWGPTQVSQRFPNSHTQPRFEGHASNRRPRGTHPSKIKEAGGKWHPARGVWILPLRRARALGVQDRIVAVLRAEGLFYWEQVPRISTKVLISRTPERGRILVGRHRACECVLG